MTLMTADLEKKFEHSLVKKNINTINSPDLLKEKKHI